MTKWVFAITAVLSFLTAEMHASYPKVIKVLIEEAPMLKIAATGSFDLFAKDSDQAYVEGFYLPQTDVYKAEKNWLFVKGFSKGFWGGIRIEAQEESSIVINGVRYRGRLDIQLDPKTGMLQAFNYIPIDDYLRGVVGREVAYYWPQEVLKAQAIIARSYTYDRIQKQTYEGYDLKATAESQMYGGVSAEMPQVDLAVKATKGKLLLHEGKIFPTFYHSTCSGHTEASHDIWDFKVAPLKGKVCSYCDISPHNKWTKTLSRETIQEALLTFSGGQDTRVKSVKVLTRSNSGRVRWMKVSYANGKKVSLSGNTFRLKVGPSRLKSTRFQVYKKGKNFVFEGSGWGHGVGLCQWGARGMAQFKKTSADKILSYYYPGARVVTG